MLHSESHMFAYLCSERSCSYTPQGGTKLSPGRSASLSSLIGVVKPIPLRFVLTWQKSAEDENLGNYPGERSEGSVTERYS